MASRKIVHLPKQPFYVVSLSASIAIFLISMPFDGGSSGEKLYGVGSERYQKIGKTEKKWNPAVT